uniref:Putative secreted protein n=1 Tax=Anopheles marajoara TaxID=58244 RepID=A0A2M4CCU6_9DIPT
MVVTLLAATHLSRFAVGARPGNRCTGHLDCVTAVYRRVLRHVPVRLECGAVRSKNVATSDGSATDRVLGLRCLWDVG